MNCRRIRTDYRLITDWINPNSSVLDLGCGSGELLYVLIKGKKVRAQGVEIDEQCIYKCIAKGLNVFHGDIDSGLSDYRDRSFDYVILNQSLQQVRHFETVFNDALRVGNKVILGLPNFAYYKARLQLFFFGKAPVTPSLPYSWYDSPNAHFLSIRDFIDFCRRRGVNIEKNAYLDEQKRIFMLPNLFASSGLFLVSR